MSTPDDRIAYRPVDLVPLLGVSLDTIYEALRSGQLPGRKICGSWIIPRQKFGKWLEDGKR